MPTLDTALIYLLFAVIGVVGCRLLHLPAMLGYLVAGIFLAQGGAMVEANEVAVASVAEIGVVLLMFVIGFEFNLPKLMGMRRMVFGFGMGQVVLMLAGTLIGHFLLANILASFNLPWDLNWQGAVVLGAALAMSSRVGFTARAASHRCAVVPRFGRGAFARADSCIGSDERRQRVGRVVNGLAQSGGVGGLVAVGRTKSHAGVAANR